MAQRSSGSDFNDTTARERYRGGVRTRRRPKRFAVARTVTLQLVH